MKDFAVPLVCAVLIFLTMLAINDTVTGGVLSGLAGVGGLFIGDFFAKLFRQWLARRQDSSDVL